MDSPEARIISVGQRYHDERLDVFAGHLLSLSRGRSADLIAAGNITVNGKTVRKSYRVQTSDQVRIVLPDAPAELGSHEDKVPLEIVFADDDIVVVNKPVGMAAHPSVGWSGPSVSIQLPLHGYTIATTGAAERQGIVQRLDVGTSGLMVVARTEYAYSQLKAAFRNREPKKTYHALVQGHIEPLRGTIDAPIGRDPSGAYRFSVRSDGRNALTHYDLLEMLPHGSLLEVDLETGRTHQIRVHFSSLNHPLLGDTTYGADPTLAGRLGLVRQWLHAVQLEIVHPGTGKWVSFDSDYPPDLQDSLDSLRTGY